MKPKPARVPFGMYPGLRGVLVSKYSRQKLIEARKATGMSAKEVSLELGKGKAFVENLENGRNLLSDDTVELLAKFYDLPLKFFLRPGVSPAVLKAHKATK